MQKSYSQYFVTRTFISLSWIFGALSLLVTLPLLPLALNPDEWIIKSILVSYIFNSIHCVVFRKSIETTVDSAELKKKLKKAVAITVILFLSHFTFTISLSSFQEYFARYEASWIRYISLEVFPLLFLSFYAPFVSYFVKKTMDILGEPFSDKWSEMGKRIFSVAKGISYLVGIVLLPLFIFYLWYALDPFDRMYKSFLLAGILNVLHLLYFFIRKREVKDMGQLKELATKSVNITLLQYFIHSLFCQIVIFQPALSPEDMRGFLKMIPNINFLLLISFYLPLIFLFLSSYLKEDSVKKHKL